MVYLRPKVKCSHGVLFNSDEECQECKKIREMYIQGVLDFLEEQKKPPVCRCPGFCVLHTKIK